VEWSCKRRWEQQCDAVFVEVPPSLSEPRRWCRGGSEEEGPLRVGSSCARHMDARGAWVQAAGGLARSGLAGHLFGWRRPVRERDDNTPLAGRRDVGPHQPAGVRIFRRRKVCTYTSARSSCATVKTVACFYRSRPAWTWLFAQTPNRRPTGKSGARGCLEAKAGHHAHTTRQRLAKRPSTARCFFFIARAARRLPRGHCENCRAHATKRSGTKTHERGR
jgi:hypothetical protein